MEDFPTREFNTSMQLCGPDSATTELRPLSCAKPSLLPLAASHPPLLLSGTRLCLVYLLVRAEHFHDHGSTTSVASTNKEAWRRMVVCLHSFFTLSQTNRRKATIFQLDSEFNEQLRRSRPPSMEQLEQYPPGGERGLDHDCHAYVAELREVCHLHRLVNRD